MSMESTNKKIPEHSVTIIIAAYQRAEALNLTLQSVCQQTYKNWRVLIVADCCPIDFIEKINLSDERISITNLPVRCGNQYGPNSIGILLAESEYIAFLNHDDIWLNDHLETAVKTIEQTNSDFFIGKAAFCKAEHQTGLIDKLNRLVFSELNRPEAIWRCITKPNYFFEPVSSWVIKTELAKEIGFWQPPDTIPVTPVQDWLQRAVKAGANFCSSQEVGVLKFNLHQFSNSEQPLYYKNNNYLKYINFYLDTAPAQVRKILREDISLTNERELSVRNESDGSPLEMNDLERDRLLQFLLFIQTGININSPVNLNKTRKIRGKTALNKLTQRTGERLEQFISVNELINKYKANLHATHIDKIVDR